MLQKQKDRYLQFKDLVTSYVELENRIKALGKKQTIKYSSLKESGNNQNVHERNLL